MADRDSTPSPIEEKPRSIDSDDKLSGKEAVEHDQLNHLHVATHSVVSTEVSSTLQSSTVFSTRPPSRLPVKVRTTVSTSGAMTFFATIGGLLFGYDTGAISSVLVQVGTDLDNKPLTDGDKEFITSALTVGAIISALCAGVIADKVGRKWTLVICDVMFIVGAIIQAAAHKKWEVIPGRLILGLGVGAAAKSYRSTFKNWRPLVLEEGSHVSTPSRLQVAKSLLML